MLPLNFFNSGIMHECGSTEIKAYIRLRYHCLLSLFIMYLLLYKKYRQESLLSAISEKDANIALLELSVSRKKTNADEVQSLKKEKDRLMVQLKQQVRYFLGIAIHLNIYIIYCGEIFLYSSYPETYSLLAC